MTPEVKLRTLAMEDATLQSFFGMPPFTGTNPFRWWDIQLRQDSAFPSVTVRRISTIRGYQQSGIQDLSRPRFQFDIRAKDSEVGRAAAVAIINWLGTIDLAASNQFDSPPTTPPQSPNFVLNQRDSMDYQLQPPVYVQTLDVRIFNREN